MNKYDILTGWWKRECIEEIAVGNSRFEVDCGSKDRIVNLYCDIHGFHRCGRFVRSEFNPWIEVAEKVNDFLFQAYL